MSVFRRSPDLFARRVWCRAVLVAGFAALAVVHIPVPVAAQTKPDAKSDEKAAGKKASEGAAEKSYAAGVAAFDKGKVDSAVTALSAALRQGGLPPAKMAKALFYRGSAYRKQGKPAQAISDLTSSVWIKGGLSDADRLAAIDQRKAAYQEAGLGNTVPKGLRPGASVPSTATAKAVTTPIDELGAATSGWSATADTGETQVAAAPAPTPSAQPARVPTTASTQYVAPPPSLSLSALPRSESSTPPPTAAPTASSGTGDSTLSNIGTSISQGFSNVGSFFGNVFSSSEAPSSGAATAAAPPTSSAIATAGASAPSVSAAATKSAPAVTQGWGPATQPPASPSPVRTAALPQTATKPAPVKARGKFRLQVAAVRSQAQAEQIVARLRTQYANQLGDAETEIDATAIGNMGTFYRVRVGPYANTKAPQGLCATLNKDGFDCLIATP